MLFIPIKLGFKEVAQSISWPIPFLGEVVINYEHFSSILGLNLFANGNLVVAMGLQFFNVLLVDWDCLGLGLALHLFLAFRENKKMKFGDLKNLENGETLIFELLQKIVGKLGKPGGKPGFWGNGGKLAEIGGNGGLQESKEKWGKSLGFWGLSQNLEDLYTNFPFFAF